MMMRMNTSSAVATRTITRTPAAPMTVRRVVVRSGDGPLQKLQDGAKDLVDSGKAKAKSAADSVKENAAEAKDKVQDKTASASTTTKNIQTQGKGAADNTTSAVNSGADGGRAEKAERPQGQGWGSK